MAVSYTHLDVYKRQVDHFLEAIKFPIAKCLIVGEPTRLAVLEKEMYEHLKDLSLIHILSKFHLPILWEK